MVTGASVKGTWVRLLHPPVEGRLASGFEGVDVGHQLRVQLVLPSFDVLQCSPWIAYNRANVRPPAGEYLVSAPSRPWAARVGRTVPSIRISFAVTLRP